MPRDIFRLAYSVRMEAEESDTAEVMLYGEIVEDGPALWKWSEEDKSAAEFDKAIKGAKKAGARKLLLRINSPGGVCTQSAAMRSILSNAGFEEINIRIEGLCASAATDIATLPGAHVQIAEGSEYMIHNPWCMAVGNAADMEHTAERLRNIEQVTRGYYMKRTGQSEEQIKAWMDAETWFTADQAVEYGFADEVLRAEAQEEMPAVACVTDRVMATMKGIYREVPKTITERAEENVRNEIPAAGVSSEIKQNEEDGETMDIKELNLEQLRAENPALLAQIQQNAVAAERERQDEIDALTDPGYEALAEAAKKDGTSPADFLKQLVAAKKAKAQDFMSARKNETAPNANIAGGEPEANRKSEEQEIQDNAKIVAEYARQYRGANETMF